tara:strand:+ start:935 stop:1858 length:924 start_codon:yes stop_codon:yes gene_type:complete
LIKIKAMHKSIYPILIFLILFFGCSKDSFNAQTPSYLHIESIDLETLNAQGTDSHKITDAWVSMDGIFLGVFELPCTIPVLSQGFHSFSVSSGIKANGISATRSIYPFYQICDLYLFNGQTYVSSSSNSVELFLDSTVTVKAITQYADDVEFIFIEDFEDAGAVLEATSISDTMMFPTVDDSLVFEGEVSGVIYLDDTNDFFELISSEFVPIPSIYNQTMLEMNYRCDNSFKLGIAVRDAQSGLINKYESIQINPSENWNKIYIQMTNQVNLGNSSDEFGIFLGAIKNSSQESATFYFDNIKWLRDK